MQKQCAMRFVDVKNDVAFKKIFGNEKKKIILISFLNAVLDLKENKRINDVTLVNPYQLPRIIEEKSTIIDVKATDNNGSTFIIEMQVAEPRGLAKRVLYYTSKDYAAQINVGIDYPQLRPVYFIGILNFNYFPNKHYFSKHLIIEEETGQCILEDLQFRFIELTKFKKNIDELNTIIDKWTFFIKNAKNLDVIPTDIEDEGLKEAYNQAAEFNWTKEEHDAYIYAGMREQDAIGIITAAEMKVEKRVTKSTFLAVAKKMLEKNEPVEKIIEYTGLTKEEIEELINK